MACFSLLSNFFWNLSKLILKLIISITNYKQDTHRTRCMVSAKTRAILVSRVWTWTVSKSKPKLKVFWAMKITHQMNIEQTNVKTSWNSTVHNSAKKVMMAHQPISEGPVPCMIDSTNCQLIFYILVSNIFCLYKLFLFKY